MKKTQSVLIKGTKDGLTLHLDDQCSFEELKKELNEKLIENQRVNHDHPLITVSVQIGNRYLTPVQQEEIKTLIRQKKNLVVGSIESNVLTKADAEEMMKENEIVSIAAIVRSGQVLEVPGDLLLVGDVNPGGKVVAGGNIYIMGTLKGMAHAGANGNLAAIISASVMMPTQLKIHDIMSRAPDILREDEQREMECAYIDEHQQMIIDRLQVLMHLRPQITRMEGGR